VKLVVLKIARDCCRSLYKEKKPDIDISPLHLLAKLPEKPRAQEWLNHFAFPKQHQIPLRVRTPHDSWNQSEHCYSFLSNLVVFTFIFQSSKT